MCGGRGGVSEGQGKHGVGVRAEKQNARVEGLQARNFSDSYAGRMKLSSNIMLRPM